MGIDDGVSGEEGTSNLVSCVMGPRVDDAELGFPVHAVEEAATTHLIARATQDPGL